MRMSVCMRGSSKKSRAKLLHIERGSFFFYVGRLVNLQNVMSSIERSVYVQAYIGLVLTALKCRYELLDCNIFTSHYRYK